MGGLVLPLGQGQVTHVHSFEPAKTSPRINMLNILPLVNPSCNNSLNTCLPRPSPDPIGDSDLTQAAGRPVEGRERPWPPMGIRSWRGVLAEISTHPDPHVAKTVGVRLSK